MKHINTLLVLLLMSASLQAQVTIQQGAQLHAAGNITLTFDNINVANNDNLANLSGSVVVIKGTGEVLLNGSGNWSVGGLVINKPSGITMLGSPFQVTDSIKLQQGLLHLNGQVVTLLPTATIEGENENNRIVGPDGGEIMMTLPMNAPVAVNAGKMGAVISSIANLGNVTIKRGHQARIPQNNGSSILRYYEIIPSANQGLNATLHFHYLDAELNSLAENDLELFGSTSNGGNWEPQSAGFKDVTGNYVERTGINALQQLYTLSAVVQGPLPLLWGSIQAGCDNNKVAVRWETLQEQNTGHFVVQRSTNGTQWKDIGTVSAAGNSSATLSYSLFDKTAPAGIALMYRIIAVDLDASKNISTIVVVQSCAVPVAMKLAPVPAVSQTILSVYTPEAYRAVIRIVDAGGRVRQQVTRNIQHGNNQVMLDVSRLAPGVYYVQVENGNKQFEVLPLVVRGE